MLTLIVDYVITFCKGKGIERQQTENLLKARNEFFF